jgi:hypothetical protein
VPYDASRVHHLASWARAKDKHGEVRALFCKKLVEAQKAREQDTNKRMEVED